MKSNRLLVASAVLCLAAGSAFAQSDDPEAIESTAPRPGDRAAEWSPDVMRAAQEAALPSVNPDAVRSAARKLRAGRDAGEPGGTKEADAASGGTGERASGRVGDRPLYWAGKLFFSKPDGNYVCSGQFISPRVVLTAAHCVRNSDTGAWYDNVAFALQYNDGKFSQVYRTECFATLGGWVSQDESKWNYDFATILVDAPSKTGHFGTQWNWEGQHQSAVKIGYPTSILDGQVIQVEQGPIGVFDGIVEMNHGNPKDQGGSSGGAWIADFSSDPGTDGNRVITVQSFHYEGLEGWGFGPYLQDSFRKLWQYTENGCR